LLIGGAIMGIFVNGMLGGYGTLLAELYPTEARATAENVLFNLGRGIGGFGPLVVGALVAAYSFEVAIGVLAVIYVIDIVVTYFLIPEKKGAALALDGLTPAKRAKPITSRQPSLMGFASLNPILRRGINGRVAKI